MIFFSKISNSLLPKLGLRGVTALEFAIVAPITLFLLLNTFFCAILYFYQFGLTSTAEYAARQVITGQAACRQAQSGASGSQVSCGEETIDASSAKLSIKQDICLHGLPFFMSCDYLTVNIQHSSSVNGSKFIQNISKPSESIDIGSSGDFIFVTLYYRANLPLFYPLFNQDMQNYFMQGLGFSNDSNTGAIVIATVSAKSEQF